MILLDYSPQRRKRCKTLWIGKIWCQLCWREGSVEVYQHIQTGHYDKIAVLMLIYFTEKRCGGKMCYLGYVRLICGCVLNSCLECESESWYCMSFRLNFGKKPWLIIIILIVQRIMKDSFQILVAHDGSKRIINQLKNKKNQNYLE